MVSTRAQKRSATDVSNPLHQPGILQRVLDYVGAAHWCFVAEVSSLWRVLYFRVACTETHLVGCNYVPYSPQTTKFSAVFASPSRVRHAAALGLHCTTAAYERAAGKYADIATLITAHELGMPYSDRAMLEAADFNDLAVVQFLRAQGCALNTSMFTAAAARGDTAMCAYLHAEQCPWNTRACSAAARNGHASTLRWLMEHGCPWNAFCVQTSAAEGGSVEALQFLQEQGIVPNAGMLAQMLNVAGAHNKLAAAKWMRAQGAQWPTMLVWCTVWPSSAVEWARAEGCTSPTEWPFEVSSDEAGSDNY
jgi:hypothetical protein